MSALREALHQAVELLADVIEREQARAERPRAKPRPRVIPVTEVDEQLARRELRAMGEIVPPRRKRSGP